MTHKLVIETERQLRDVYSATFSQPLLEQLAASFIAEQQGINLDAAGVRLQFETNVSPDANPKRKVNMRVSIFVETPLDAEPEAVQG